MVVVSNEIASFSEDIIKKYNKDRNISIIIANSKEQNANRGGTMQNLEIVQDLKKQMSFLKKNLILMKLVKSKKMKRKIQKQIKRNFKNYLIEAMS